MAYDSEMNPRSERIAVALWLAACLLLSGAALAQNTERPVKMKDLPKVVQATVREQSQGAVVRGLSMETENGQTFYEVSLKVKDHNKDVLIDTEGKVVEIEEQVALGSLPPAAKAEIEKQVGKGKILLVESVTKDAAIVAYEAHFRTQGKLREVKVSPDGKEMK